MCNTLEGSVESLRQLPPLESLTWEFPVFDEEFISALVDVAAHTQVKINYCICINHIDPLGALYGAAQLHPFITLLRVIEWNNPLETDIDESISNSFSFPNLEELVWNSHTVAPYIPVLLQNCQLKKARLSSGACAYRIDDGDENDGDDNDDSEEDEHWEFNFDVMASAVHTTAAATPAVRTSRIILDEVAKHPLEELMLFSIMDHVSLPKQALQCFHPNNSQLHVTLHTLSVLMVRSEFIGWEYIRYLTGLKELTILHCNMGSALGTILEALPP